MDIKILLELLEIPQIVDDDMKTISDDLSGSILTELPLNDQSEGEILQLKELVERSETPLDYASDDSDDDLLILDD